MYFNIRKVRVYYRMTRFHFVKCLKQTFDPNFKCWQIKMAYNGFGFMLATCKRF